MIAAVLILTARGDVVIHRAYRDDVTRAVADAFRTEVIAASSSSLAAEEGTQLAPVRLVDAQSSFLHSRKNGLYFTALARTNVNAVLVFEFLFQLQRIFAAYLGDDFSENDIRGNFTLVYELLDEVLDFGYPQNCSVEMLKLYINLGNVKEVSPEKSKKLTPEITGAVDWRRAGVKHKKNEVFVDVMEEMSLLVSVDGSQLSCEAAGSINLKVFLSGMPECQLSLNDKISLSSEPVLGDETGAIESTVEFADCTFHRCVKLGQFERDRTITFVPPDGEFVLMKYRISENVSVPFQVIPVVEEIGKTKVVYNVRLICQIPGDETAKNIVLKIPCPGTTAKARPFVTKGKAKYDPVEQAILWRIRKLVGGMEATFTCTVDTVPSTKEKSWSRPPIQVNFMVPMWTASGMKVRYLKVIEQSYARSKVYVKYLTKASDSFQVRM